MSAAELLAAADRLEECDATTVLLHYDDNGDALGETEIPLSTPLAEWLRVTERDTGSSALAYKAAEVVARAINGGAS